ncbi:hypothetical protein EDB85DRAFT_2043012 [Lactarius pseudohatsudake]|nr:hypothetical protein EDB85DRAFT_2043012 [Lactarius pseudohatsudake]
MLDSAVPTKLLNLCAYKFEREFTHMHYSAAMGHPDNFKDNGFTVALLVFVRSVESTAYLLANDRGVSFHCISAILGRSALLI